MTVGTDYFDSSQVGHLDVQGRFAHAGSFPCSSVPARTGPATVSFPRETKHPRWRLFGRTERTEAFCDLVARTMSLVGQFRYEGDDPFSDDSLRLKFYPELQSPDP